MRAKPLFHGVLLATALQLAVVLPVLGSAAEAARAFDEGNQQYALGNYRGAVDSYERALDAGYTSAALYHNLGSAHYRRDEIGHAIRYFERARALAPDDPEIQHNLAIANGRTQDRFSRLPVPVWERWWHAVIRGPGAWGLFGVGIAFWFSAAAMLLYRQFNEARPAWARRLLAICVLLGVSFLAAAFLASIEPQRQQRGVVVTAQVLLRAEPSATADPELTIHEGLVVRILDDRADWARLRLPNGVEGWVSRSAVAEI